MPARPGRMRDEVLRRPAKMIRALRVWLLVGTAALVLSGCVTTGTSTPPPDFAAMSQPEAEAALVLYASRYKAKPNDRQILIGYAAALRANRQAAQATALLEGALGKFGSDPDVRIAYAKALAAEGQFARALTTLDGVIRPEAPDWSVLSLQGAIYDQMGRSKEARAAYRQALTLAPNEASIHANLGLSYAMTNDLASAERHLRQAVKLPGANGKIRQNLALVLGLQGRFEEARALFAASLPAAQVEANMASIRALLTQQNRWDAIKAAS